MARLPNAGRAEIDLRKLTDYVLDPLHRTGRHKARVFAAALGIGPRDAQMLAQALRDAAAAEDAEFVRRDHHGDHYRLAFTMHVGRRSAMMRSLWTVRAGEDFPRFVSVFVQKEAEGDG